MWITRHARRWHACALAPASWRAIAFVLCCSLYVVLILGVIQWSPFLTIDRDVFRLDLPQRLPGWFPALHTYVMLGQRAPATLVALPWFLWRAWKSRSSRPLVMLGDGAARAEPQRRRGQDRDRSARPARHQARARGLRGRRHLPVRARVQRRRALRADRHAGGLVPTHRVRAGGASSPSPSGWCTVYLDTHWMSDVFGGWLAGLLVLISLPWIMPYSQRAADAVSGWVRSRLRRSGLTPPATEVAPAEPVTLTHS